MMIEDVLTQGVPSVGDVHHSLHCPVQGHGLTEGGGGLAIVMSLRMIIKYGLAILTKAKAHMTTYSLTWSILPASIMIKNPVPSASAFFWRNLTAWTAMSASLGLLLVSLTSWSQVR